MIAEITVCLASFFSPENFYSRPDSVATMVAEQVATTPTNQLPTLLEQADSLWFTPGSPTECEALYALWLEQALPRLTATDAEVAQWKLNGVCRLNAEGSAAADFTVKLADGKQVKMSRYLPGQPLLVVFYDPMCRHCHSTISALAKLNLPSRRLNVLAVCVEGSNELWADTRDALPQGWRAAYDLDRIVDNEIYLIRSLPSIYLLDAQRKVLLKNPPVERLKTFLDTWTQ